VARYIRPPTGTERLDGVRSAMSLRRVSILFHYYILFHHVSAQSGHSIPYLHSVPSCHGTLMQVPSPELGPLERRVEKTFLEGLFSEEISVEDTNYWFEEPDGPPPPRLFFQAICMV